MKKGFLVVNVYNDTVANPVRNATVIISKDGLNLMTLLTNEDGQTEEISLDTVSLEYSQTNQKEVQPYETYEITVSAIGLTTTTIEGVQIYEDITSIQNVYMTTVGEENTPRVYELPPNTLWGNYPPKLEEQQENNTTNRVLREIVIPKNIVVHDGIPSNTNAPNYTVPFIDYIKNVASSEIYSTWPYETIKANVLAIISFTLNRIYTEWYPSKGYNFTITSTTSYDQKYTRNGTIFKSISQVVDEIFTNYIRVGIRVEPLLAYYRDETNESGILSQWGSKDLGDRGYKALEILRHYYGNVNIYEAEIKGDYPYSFTQTLQEGTCNYDVYVLQNALNYIRGSYPGIPLIKNPSGKYNSETTNAVKTFQRIFSLAETGRVNRETWYKISYILTAVSDMTNSIYS